MGLGTHPPDGEGALTLAWRLKGPCRLPLHLSFSHPASARKAQVWTDLGPAPLPTVPQTRWLLLWELVL